MIILTCPKCSEPVTMPSGLRPTAQVRCPLCQEEYSLADALGKLPPALIPLDPNDLVAAPAGAVERPVEPTWESGDAELELEPATPGFSFSTDSPAAPAATGGAPRIVSKPRRKPKPKNPVVEVVKVVGGGVAGLVIAQLLLWWFPVKQYRRDPFELGPTVGKIGWLRFIVPSTYWPDEAVKPPADQPTDDGANGGALGDGRAAGGSSGLAPNGATPPGKVDWNAVISEKPGAGDQAAKKPNVRPNGKFTGRADSPAKPADDLRMNDDLIADEPVGPSTPANPLVDLNIGLDTPPAPAPKPKTQGAAKPAPPPTETPADDVPSDPLADPLDSPAPKPAPQAPAKPADEPQESSDSKPEPKSETKPDAPADDGAKPAEVDPEQLPAPASADGRSAAEIRQLLTAAEASTAAWVDSASADRDERRRRGGALFVALARLAKADAEADRSDAEISPVDAAVREFGQKLIAEPINVRLVELQAAQRVADEQAAGKGVVLFGAVKSVEAKNELHVVKLELAGKSPVEVEVQVSGEAPEAQPGDRLLVLGVVDRLHQVSTRASRIIAAP